VLNRLDVYTAVHKMQRARLCALIVEAGTADPHDATGRARLANSVQAAIAELHAHAEHEDRFIHPLLREKAPHIAVALDAEHVELDAQLDQLGATAAGYLKSDPATGVDPNVLYRGLAGFAASYFAHVAVEESNALPAL
jgi:iron-sulfur cluster repair protein YtfE (RIC family)